MMRIDAHQHFWNYNRAEYEWISDEMAALQRDFLPEHLKPLLAANRFDGSVAVQARQSIEETLWLLELAERNECIKGVVGWVDLCAADVRVQLERLAGNQKLVGVRHVVQGEPDDEFMLRSDFRKGIGRLREFGLAYDLLLFPRHLAVARKLVREFPEQMFVLDHIAKPAIAQGLMEPWGRDIRELAKCANVSCKLSGMATEARWKLWKKEDFRPYLDAVLEAFGAQRLMIGSDWPVCTVSGDYRATMGIVIEQIERLTADEQAAILGRNCATIYRIPEQE
jgi:L-fuconolactonase